MLGVFFRPIGVVTLLLAGCAPLAALSPSVRVPGLANAAPTRVSGEVTDSEPKTSRPFSQGPLQSTGKATDLAIQGDGFLVLSRVRNPQRMGEIVFSRNGSFHFDFFQSAIPDDLGLGASKGELRLVNQDGHFVMGFRSTAEKAYQKNAIEYLPGTPAPPSEFSAFRAGGDPGRDADSLLNLPAIGFDTAEDGSSVDGYNFEPITVPFQNDPNPIGGVAKSINANFVPTFTSQGWVQVNSDAPNFDPNDPKKKLVIFVGLAKFADPTGLTKLTGGSEFGWSHDTGQLFLGTAGSGNWTIGGHNTIAAGFLEAGVAE